MSTLDRSPDLKVKKYQIIITAMILTVSTAIIVMTMIIMLQNEK